MLRKIAMLIIAHSFKSMSKNCNIYLSLSDYTAHVQMCRSCSPVVCGYKLNRL